MDTFEVTWQWAGGRFTSFERVEAFSTAGAVSALHHRLRRDFEASAGEVVVVNVERLCDGQEATEPLRAATTRSGSVASRERRGLARLAMWR